MDAERARAFLLTLPHVTETMQWGANLVFWVGDKAIGGKMFALINLDGGEGPVISFAAAGEHAAELLERDGLKSAPYFGRLGWIAAERWDALRARAWQVELSSAHAIVMGKLPPRMLAMLSLPLKARETAIAERKRLMAQRAASAKS